MKRYPLIEENQFAKKTQSPQKIYSDEQHMEKMNRLESQNYRGKNIELHDMQIGQPVKDYQLYDYNVRLAHQPYIQPIQDQIQEPIIINERLQNFQQPNGPQVIYYSHPQPYQVLNKKTRACLIVASPTKQQSILYGQSICCQRCGFLGTGRIELHNGRTSCAWGVGLFFLTGMFCFLPCVMKDCKDTWIICQRCGHKKVVVRSDCCC